QRGNRGVGGELDLELDRAGGRVLGRHPEGDLGETALLRGLADDLRGHMGGGDTAAKQDREAGRAEHDANLAGPAQQSICRHMDLAPDVRWGLHTRTVWLTER